MIEVHVAVEMEGTLKTGLIIKIEVLATVSHKGIFIITEVEVKIIRFEGDEDGMEMTPIIVTEITRIEIPKVKVILIGAEDGIIVEVRDIVIWGRGRRWNPNQQYHDPGYQQLTQFANPNHYRPLPMGHQY